MNNEEIELYAKAKRIIDANTYFEFSVGELVVGNAEKSTMKPAGELRLVNLGLEITPSYVAALLKGKKHEWVVAAFEAKRTVQCLWYNKGVDNEGVSLYWDIDNMLSRLLGFSPSEPFCVETVQLATASLWPRRHYLLLLHKGLPRFGRIL